jgi:hypothetical protein
MFLFIVSERNVTWRVSLYVLLGNVSQEEESYRCLKPVIRKVFQPKRRDEIGVLCKKKLFGLYRLGNLDGGGKGDDGLHM